MNRKFINKYLILLGLLLSANFTSVFAQWTVVKNINATFKIKNAGITVDGKFNKVSAKIQFNEKDLQNSNFSGRAEVSSISTGIALRDRHLREKTDFFNESKFPLIQMNSVSISEQGNGVYAVVWDFTIKGVTRRLTTVVKTLVQNGTLLLSTEFKVNRNDWDLGGSSITMGDIVTIKINTLISK